MHEAHIKDGIEYKNIGSSGNLVDWRLRKAGQIRGLMFRDFSFVIFVRIGIQRGRNGVSWI